MVFDEVFDQVMKEFEDKELACLVVALHVTHITLRPEYEELIQGGYSERLMKNWTSNFSHRYDKEKFNLGIDLAHCLHEFGIMQGLGGGEPTTLKEILSSKSREELRGVV